ncbi:MAG: hypothetical protein ACLQIK_13230 [Mycobacterium sp.]|uniref:hypothetical protein n=1 Tax=Mycobacterium sp. TaxID=1785 RepID=UPI003F9CE337
MPPNSTTYIVISVAIVVACFGGLIAAFARLRPAGRPHARRYIAIMGVAWLLLAVSAIANAARGSLWWTTLSLVLLVLIPTAVYSKIRKGPSDDSTA